MTQKELLLWCVDDPKGIEGNYLSFKCCNCLDGSMTLKQTLCLDALNEIFIWIFIHSWFLDDPKGIIIMMRRWP